MQLNIAFYFHREQSLLHLLGNVKASFSENEYLNESLDKKCEIFYIRCL